MRSETWGGRAVCYDSGNSRLAMSLEYLVYTAKRKSAVCCDTMSLTLSKGAAEGQRLSSRQLNEVFEKSEKLTTVSTYVLTVSVHMY